MADLFIMRQNKKKICDFIDAQRHRHSYIPNVFLRHLSCYSFPLCFRNDFVISLLKFNFRKVCRSRRGRFSLIQFDFASVFFASSLFLFLFVGYCFDCGYSLVACGNWTSNNTKNILHSMRVKYLNLCIFVDFLFSSQFTQNNSFFL